jgi:UDPglucose 6-dehydrogenase
MKKRRISIIGAGYLGLCTAVTLAMKGYDVTVVDSDSEKVVLINRGVPPFYEIGLEPLLQKTLREGYLKCIQDHKEAILNTSITFIAVGTPSKSDGNIDLLYIKSSAREIGKALKEKKQYHLVVVKSTVIPGTTENVVRPIIEKFSSKQCERDFGICVNPEFLREGSAIDDTLHPDRIIIGEIDRKSGDVLEALYRDFYGKEIPPLIRTNLPTAELIKYANNAFLATKISFINQIASICEKIPGVDVTDVAKGIGLDERIGSMFLNAGLGYGGSCLPKDVKALIAFSKKLGIKPTLLSAVNKVNETQPNKAIELCKTALGDIKGRCIAILGLAFKPNTDDIRGAVSIKIIKNLIKEGAKIIAYDPAAIPNTKKKIGKRIIYASSIGQCIKNADLCIIVTEWDEFKKLKPEYFIKNMKQPILIDGRRIYNPQIYSKKLKFIAIGLGYDYLKKKYSLDI